MEETKIPNFTYYAMTVDEYLRNENAIGMKFPMPPTTATAVNMYIQSGVFSDIGNSTNGLHTECRLPEKVLYSLLLEQVNNLYGNIGDSIPMDKDYKTGIKKLIQAYPELKDASLSLEPDVIFDNLYIGGRQAHQAVTYMLHFPEIPTPMLGDMLATDYKFSDDEQKQPMRADIQRLHEELKMLPNVHCKFGAERFYFFEKGKLGFATVHPDRSVRWYGEKMSGIAQGHINRIATRANFNYLDRPFFKNQALGRINMPMADTETGKVRNIYIQKYDDGTRITDIFMEKAVPLKDAIPENLISMKGRLTQVQFAERADGHYMRCRIDGEMQMYKHIKPDDYTNYEKGTLDAEQLAARYFVRDFLSMQEQRNHKMKR